MSGKNEWGTKSRVPSDEAQEHQARDTRCSLLLAASTCFNVLQGPGSLSLARDVSFLASQSDKRETKRIMVRNQLRQFGGGGEMAASGLATGWEDSDVRDK